ncbi:hypothetical protein GH714_008308 [Hevea brasiliensis]|uniref:Retrotransposon gag domain-containing protein n=1 Tax=Hevea brasiliensis TaxID=3981 RepID=A0A6A6M005_HEVBR|nr:hypothetical protein GH714_008308 [Hevea brasiliensis]
MSPSSAYCVTVRKFPTPILGHSYSWQLARPSQAVSCPMELTNVNLYRYVPETSKMLIIWAYASLPDRGRLTWGPGQGGPRCRTGLELPSRDNVVSEQAPGDPNHAKRPNGIGGPGQGGPRCRTGLELPSRDNVADTAMVWWHRRLLDIERGTCTISTWDDFKKELKKQFYPENAAHEARAKLRCLSHKGSIRDYVKEFMEILLEIPDYPDTKALFAFTDGMQNWARLEIERRGARDLATAVSIAESLIELQRRERNSSPRKERNEGSSSHGKDGSYKPYKPKEGHNKVQKEDQGMQRPPLSCFLCDGPHRAQECPKKSRLSALIEEREEAPFPQREATIGSLQLCASKVEGQKTKEARKGLPFVQMKLEGQEVLALMDPRASNNFLKEEEAKRLGIPYERETGWLKAVNSTPNLVRGVARNVKVRIGYWKDRVKAIPMLFANSICITEGGGTYMVPVLRGKSSPSKTLATMHMEVQKPSSTTTAVVHGKEQHGKGGGTPKSGPKGCKEGNTLKLLKGHPPRRKADCARGKSVAKSPRDVASPRQESPRQNHSWRSRRRCKAKGRADAPSHKDEGGTEAQLE